MSLVLRGKGDYHLLPPPQLRDKDTLLEINLETKDMHDIYHFLTRETL